MHLPYVFTESVFNKSCLYREVIEKVKAPINLTELSLRGVQHIPLKASYIKMLIQPK